MTRRLAAAALATVLYAAALPAEEWPGWRGPRGDGTSAEASLPETWGPKENVRWKAAIPGVGHSSPVVWGDRVFVATCVEDGKDGQRRLLCLNRADGSVVWDKLVLTSKLEHKHPENSFASSTPATDGKNVWVTFLDYPDMVVVCYDFDGKEVWRKSPGKLLSVHGFCTSPVLHKNLVILNGDQDAEAYLVALDKATGEERWRTDRPNRTRSYCTPILVHSAKHPDVTQLVLGGSKCVASYDADDGKQRWIIDGPTEQYVASLVFLDDTLFLTCGFPERHLMGIDPDGEGNITNTDFIRWHIGNKENREKGASYVPSPVAADGCFFVVSDVGYLSCVEAKTGKRLWMEKLGRHHHSSPVKIGDKLYFPDDDGVTWVVKASRTFEVVHKNDLKEETYASPAVAHGAIFIRTLGNLYCIGADEKK
jgi:outer membrane protein assembly factor BamB